MDGRGGICFFLSKKRFFTLANYFSIPFDLSVLLNKNRCFFVCKNGLSRRQEVPKKIVNAFSPWYNTVMENKAIFNATVCILGILILSIHAVNLIVKKGKRKDEKSLLDFFVFTIVHFATYLVFALVKMAYTSNAYIIAFYTVFTFSTTWRCFCCIGI